MVNVRLNRIVLEQYEEKKLKQLRSEVVWRAVFWIEMFDEDGGLPIPDRFFLYVASDNYSDAPNDIIDIRQEQLDVLSVVNTVKKRLTDLSVKSWDDFYLKMAEEFIYDNDD